MTKPKPAGMKAPAPASTLAVAPPAPARARGKKPSGEASARSPLIERLVAWRKKQDLTQKETAARLDINFDTYKSYECGHRNPSGPNTHKILALIGV